MSKVLILAGDAAEDLETMFVKYRLAEAELRAAHRGTDPAPDQARRARLRAGLGHVRRAPGTDVPRRRRVRRRGSVSLRGARHSRRPRARVHPGRPGRGADRRALLRRGKPVGTLCHGPQVPAALGLLRGRRSAGFGPLAPDIEMAGGEFVDGPAVIDGNMVSCRGWGDLAEWSRAFLELLDRAAVAV